LSGDRSTAVKFNLDWIRKTRRRLSLATHTSTEAYEFLLFEKRVLNVVRENIRYIQEDGIRQFCQVMGVIVEYADDGWGGPKPNHAVLLKALVGAKAPEEFLFALQVVLDLPFLGGRSNEAPQGYRARFTTGIEYAIHMSDVDVDLTVTQDQAILHPRGDPALERPLVDDALQTLTGAAARHFTDALRFYQRRSEAEHVRSAESLRRALEEYLRTRLSNSKGLSANIKHLMALLKEKGRDPTTRNVVFQTFDLLDRYFNENSKHADGAIDAAENEYLIYQTGLLVRYVDRALRT